MRIESAFSPPQTAPTASTRWAAPSNASTITSPHTPLWGGRIFSFLRWIFSFFTWFLPEKKEKPTPRNPPEEFALAVKKAKEAELANKNPIPGLIQGLIIQRGMFYLMGRPVSDFYTSVSIQATRYATDKIANFIFPQISDLKKKTGSMAISNAVIWMGSKHFQIPFNWIIFLPQAISIGMLYAKAETEKTQKRQARIAQLVAN